MNSSRLGPSLCILDMYFEDVQERENIENTEKLLWMDEPATSMRIFFDASAPCVKQSR